MCSCESQRARRESIILSRTQPSGLFIVVFVYWPYPPLTQLYSFHYYAPIVQKRFILAAPSPPLASQWPPNSPTESRSSRLSRRRISITESDTHAPAPIIDEGILRSD